MELPLPLRASLLALTLLLLGLTPTDYALMQGPAVCDGTEEPCDPDRPWMRGRVEKSCAPTADREKGWLECACRHICDKARDDTGGRKWDATCAARCNPSNCKCPHPCTT